jgi:hypothetical protein
MVGGYCPHRIDGSNAPGVRPPGRAQSAMPPAAAGGACSDEPCQTHYRPSSAAEFNTKASEKPLCLDQVAELGIHNPPLTLRLTSFSGNHPKNYLT